LVADIQAGQGVVQLGYLVTDDPLRYCLQISFPERLVGGCLVGFAEAIVCLEGNILSKLLVWVRLEALGICGLR